MKFRLTAASAKMTMRVARLIQNGCPKTTEAGITAKSTRKVTSSRACAPAKLRSADREEPSRTHDEDDRQQHVDRHGGDPAGEGVGDVGCDQGPQQRGDEGAA